MNMPRYTFASGPVDITPETARAMNKPIVYHNDPAFIETFAHTVDLMQQVYRTRHDIVLMQAEAMLGIEAAAASLIQPGTKVLNVVSGVFGKWFELFIDKYGGETIEVAVPYNEAVDPDDVRRAFIANPDISVLAVVHSETPSGTKNDVRAICGIAREYGAVTIVDTVSGLGCELYSPEDWSIDVAIAGPQKCLGGVPGMSLMAISDHAWRAMEALDKPMVGSFLSILDWKTTWLENRSFPYTPSVADIYALESVLEQNLREGMEHVVERHEAAAHATRVGVRAMGLHPWPVHDDICTACCTAVTVPDDVADADLRGLMRSRYGVMISGGYGELAGKLFRLGHMGMAAHPTAVIVQLGVLERTLADLGHPVTFGAGVGAAIDALAGWDDANGTVSARS